MERGRILDEFAAVTRLSPQARDAAASRRAARPAVRPAAGRTRLYDDAVREALIVIWEASDRICGKRLRPLVPILVEAMERHGHLQLAPEVRMGLLAMSAATIDRALRERQTASEDGRRVASAALGRSPAQRASAHIRRLGRPAAGVCRGGSGRAQRADSEGQLRADADADRHRDGLDGVCAAAGARAEAADRGAERDAQTAALRRCSGSTRTTTACS